MDSIAVESRVMPEPVLTSLTNPRVKRVVRLREQSSERRATGLFCIESSRELERARAAGFEVEELYVCTKLYRGEFPPGVVAVAEHVLAKMVVRENPEGLLAVVRAKTYAWSDVGQGLGLFVVCSGLEKPGNIGAILRSADAAGVSGVLVDSPGFDVYNPHTIRASTGAVFSTPVICDTPENLLNHLRKARVQVIAATPEADTPYTQADFTRPTAFVMGAEAPGLSPFWKEAADVKVSIPQRGTVDSLNVSVTAALLLFEAMRQRGG